MKYRTIVADPPWHYESRNGYAKPIGNARDVNAPSIGRQDLPYSTMTVDEIATLPVRDWAEDDAHLYLWTTQRYLRDAFTVLDAWGFKQGAVLVWAKKPKGVVGTFVCSTEFCVFARRGTLPALGRHMGTCFNWPRATHSQKPAAFLDVVESVSPGPYLEMFARRARFGWDYWGNESLNTAEVCS